MTIFLHFESVNIQLQTKSTILELIWPKATTRVRNNRLIPGYNYMYWVLRGTGVSVLKNVGSQIKQMYMVNVRNHFTIPCNNILHFYFLRLRTSREHVNLRNFLLILLGDGNWINSILAVYILPQQLVKC